MQALIAQLERGHDLSAAQAGEAVASLVSTDAGDDEKAHFLKALRAIGETAAQIAAFVEELLKRAIDPQIEPSKLAGPMIDVC